MEYYRGKDLNELLSYMKNSNPGLLKPMEKSDIDVIRNAKKGYEIPKLFLDFLRAAGRYFYPWEGFDYVQVDTNKQFVDLSKYINEEDDLVAQFSEYGVEWDKCLFFVTNQGIVYYFIRLDENDDDPMVYSIVSCSEKPAKPFRFSELIISSYNEIVAIEEASKDPWNDFSESLGVIKRIEENYPFKNTDSNTLKTDIYTKYKVRNSQSDSNCLEYLNPILSHCLGKHYSVYVYTDAKLYIYRVREDSRAYNKIGLDIYKDKTAVLDMRYEWGWFTVDNEVYIFGEEFIKKIKENIGKFDLLEEE